MLFNGSIASTVDSCSSVTSFVSTERLEMLPMSLRELFKLTSRYSTLRISLEAGFSGNARICLSQDIYKLADLRSTTCSKESCDLLSKQNRVLLKRAFVSKILKHLGRKMADFVACLHLRLRGFQNESDRLHELRERLHHHFSPI